MSTSSRDVAVAVQLEVEGGGSAGAVLHHALQRGGVSGGQASRATALALGSVRLRARCDTVLRPLLQRPPEELDAVLRAVLRVGTFELLWTRSVLAPAAVDELVGIARRRGHRGLAQVTNAVLRRVARDAGCLREPPPRLSPTEDPLAWLTEWESLPTWLAGRWVARFGSEQAVELGRWSNREPDLSLRVNRLRADRERLLRVLAEEDVSATPGALSDLCVRVAGGGNPVALPGFAGGWYSVQDEAAMLVAPLSGAAAGDRCLELCAAPGGKATHLAEQMDNRGSVLACDRDAGRLGQLETAAERLGLTIIETLARDARRLVGELEPADVVLLDAPCTGTGTLARRADARWRMGPERLAEAVALQRELLAVAAVLTRPGGILVYATCSLEEEENEAQMRWLASTHPELRPDGAVESAPPGWSGERAEVTLLPGPAGHDGFFLARRRRQG